MRSVHGRQVMLSFSGRAQGLGESCTSIRVYLYVYPNTDGHYLMCLAQRGRPDRRAAGGGGRVGAVFQRARGPAGGPVAQPAHASRVGARRWLVPPTWARRAAAVAGMYSSNALVSCWFSRGALA